MCKRVAANLRDGMNPLMALDLTLLDFRGAKNDARIGAVVQAVNSEKQEGLIYALGVNDSDRGEKCVRTYTDLKNEVLFVYDKDTKLEKRLKLDTKAHTAEEIAEFLHTQLMPSDREFRVATGVSLLFENSGVFNEEFDEAKVAKWRKSLES